jgi:phosphoenolpyruvate carboxylase
LCHGRALDQPPPHAQPAHMPPVAAAIRDLDKPAPQPTKRVRIPPRIRHACELLANGNVATVTAAAERAGLSREHLSKMLSQPHIRAFLTRKATETIRTASLRASTRLVELIDAKSEHVAAQVSERILTSEGILKSDQGSNIAVNVDIRAGYVIKLNGQAPALKSGVDVEIDGSSS